jgi:hypothetical protein
VRVQERGHFARVDPGPTVTIILVLQIGIEQIVLQAQGQTLELIPVTACRRLPGTAEGIARVRRRVGGRNSRHHRAEKTHNRACRTGMT